MSPELTRLTLERARRGDAAAFDELVRAHLPRVYGYCARYLGNPDQASDATQETFLRALKAIKRFRGDSAFTTWLLSIATNVCKDEVLKSSRHPIMPADEEGPAPWELLPASGDTPEEATLRRERSQVVLEAITRLAPEFREVLLLRDLEGLSYDELAQLLGAKEGTVKSRLNRARLALREELTAQRELFVPLVGPSCESVEPDGRDDYEL